MLYGTIPLLPKSEVQRLQSSSAAAQHCVLDLVGNPEDMSVMRLNCHCSLTLKSENKDHIHFHTKH